LIRHRPASYGQESQRYVKYNGMEFIKPSWFKKLSNKAEEIFAKNCLEVEKTYKELIDLGLKAQEARVVLSNQVATQIAVTAPIWEWEHIFKLRCSNAAYPQIRELMNETRNEIRKIENN
jgi:thymidylate synthase (FAD)